ncbi:MAG: 2-amino-4-hydroxy-6-hydroxymethyldihydropteridine diphosphokinase [Prevotella sp.]|nr:2-amino-4-hydroxy-6-hydroxymethyldihydropteridine diphosphokinase [Prevotella sp.]
MTHTAYLGLGSNLGNKQQNIGKAVEKINELIGTVECQSALFFSKPWGFSSDNDFVNAVVKCTTALSPRELLHAVQKIEKELGKTTKSRKNINGRLLKGESYRDRIIDIDILLYDDLMVNEPDLQIPHPLMAERDFVMVPLREIQENEKNEAQ